MRRFFRRRPPDAPTPAAPRPAPASVPSPEAVWAEQEAEEARAWQVRKEQGAEDLARTVRAVGFWFPGDAGGPGERDYFNAPRRRGRLTAWARDVLGL